MMRVVQSLQGMVQPHRKTWALRLFTERDAVSRFSPDAVGELLSQLRRLVEQLGPPPGWHRGPLPPQRAWPIARPGPPGPPRRTRAAPAPVSESRAPARPRSPFSRSPVNYTLSG